MQVRALAGQVHADCSLAQGGDVLTSCDAELTRGASLTLSLDDHVQVVLTGPAVVQLLPSGRHALLLREGQLSLDVAPHGLRASEGPFWLATPTLRMEVGDGVRVALRANEQASALAVVSGTLTLSRPEGALVVPSGSALCVSAREAKELPQPAPTLEGAALQLAKLTACAHAARVAPADARTLLEQSLEGALASVQQASERERDMLVEHTRLAASRDARALALRAELAQVGVALLRGRERARALRAQLEALVVARAPAPSTSALLQRASSLAVSD